MMKMKWLAPAAMIVCLMGGSTATAEVLLIDFNNSASTPTFGGAWNTISSPAGTTLLFDTAGAATTAKVSFSGSWYDSAINAAWPHGDTLWIAGNAATDAFYSEYPGSRVSVIYGGLDPDRVYQVDHLAVRETSTDPVADYTIFGQFADSNPNGDDFDAIQDGFANATVLTWDTVTPNAAGEVVLQLDGRGFGYAAAGRITVVPEPDTLVAALLGLLSLGVNAGRGRRFGWG